MLMNGPKIPRQFICISIIHCLRTINSSTIDVGIIACVCVCVCVCVCSLPNSPSELKFELRPSWNDIHDTFPTGTVQDTKNVPREQIAKQMRR